jgi:Flp pilus assembly protein TadG
MRTRGTMARIENLRLRLQEFRKAEGGNVLITFALAILPIVAFVGAAVDYSRGNSAKAAIQAAADGTTLMLSKDAPNLSKEQLGLRANEIFQALLNRPEVTNLTVTPVFNEPQLGNFKLELTATANVPTMFMRAFGHQTLAVDVYSEALWGIKKLELALALDNTGSMASSGKMSNLKTAAKTLLTTMKNAAKTEGDVKVAIIPFDTTVKIGTSYKDQDWFDTGDPKTLYPVEDCGSLAQAMPLSTDWTALNGKVDEMSPSGNTNVTIGLVWAWHALTANTPYPEGSAPTPNLDKVIIILTDGDNTEAWDNINSKKVTTRSAIDARTELVCNNIKAANIRIYAVRVIDGNATLLRNCATNPTMYYDVQQASELNSVFSAIAQNLANLRIAK